MIERALTFECDGEELVGVLAEPVSPKKVGVLIIVGGPQYRVGSHRQFVLLARRLAAAHIAVMRFDYRGMGDATGAMARFEEIVADIDKAISTMRTVCPAVEQVVLCGLCDAASAALIYWQSTHDARVAGMILLNPWVRSVVTLARTNIKHYYGRRILDKTFWAKLARGQIDIGDALRTIARDTLAARAKKPSTVPESTPTFQDRMADGLDGFRGPILLILSGRDLTAKEFLEYAHSNSRWRGLLERPNVTRRDADTADHTFSSERWREQIETSTLQWLSEAFFPVTR